MSLNLTQRQIADPELLKIIYRALDEYHLSPELLAVKVTESTVMEDRSNAFETLRRLAERGIGIAIDNFVTGYSSMGYLQKLPVDLVKIDRSFISGIDRSKSDFAITSALIQVCQSLGKTVVPEVSSSSCVSSIATRPRASCSRRRSSSSSPHSPRIRRSR